MPVLTDSRLALLPSSIADDQTTEMPDTPVLTVFEEPSPAKHGHQMDAAHKVSEASVEESIESKRIGERIRRLRLKRSMGLVELGKHTGLSASFLSQLETGRVVPTLRNLSRIALVFGKELTYFFQDERKNQFKTSHAKDRVRLSIGDKASPVLISESMSALIPDRSLVPCIADFLPNPGSATFEPSQFSGQEFIYVIKGSMIVSTENNCQQLETADTAWIDGLSKRKYSCAGKTPVRAMIISCRM